jgi:hypothetical protein
MAENKARKDKTISDKEFADSRKRIEGGEFRTMTQETVFAWGRDVPDTEMERRVADSAYVVEVGYNDEKTLREEVAKLLADISKKGYCVSYVHRFEHPATSYIHVKKVTA